MSADFSGFGKLTKVLDDFRSLNGKDIKSALSVEKIVISETKEKAKERDDYEKFMKTGLSNTSKEAIENNIKHFIEDTLKKDL